MNTVWDILYLRRPVLNYVAPSICEVIFSGSSNPVIVLSDFPIGQVTGLVLSGEGAFRLSWNAFPGAICYNIYFVGGDSLAVILAQCVTDPFFDLPPGLGPGELIVTPITEEGEGPPSDPVILPGGGGTVMSVSLTVECTQTGRSGFPGVFRITRNGTIGNLLVGYTISGTAVNGSDYDLIPTFATIPHGSSFVLIDINPNDGAMSVQKNVRLTLNESLTYFVNPDNTGVVLIKPPILRINNYGGAQPLFTPPAGSIDSESCEWEGVFNVFAALVDPPEAWWFEDEQGMRVEPTASIQGKQLYFAFVGGPYQTTTTRGDVGPIIWQVSIFTLTNTPEQGDVPELVWNGTKEGGNTGSPSGTYLNNGGGSDSRASITLSFFP